MAEGVFSFASAMFALACFAVLGITSVHLFIVPAIGFAVVAAVFGIIGIKRRKPGYALTGLIAGLLEVVAGLIVLALFL